MTSPPASSAEFLANIFRTEDPHKFQGSTVEHAKVKPFEVKEVEDAARAMARGKSKDKGGITLEMILHGGRPAFEALTRIFNDMLVKGFEDTNWHITFFNLLPKSGDLLQPGNWRPIAILPVCYKIFAKVLYFRLRYILQAQQGDEQMGFQPGRRCDDALFVLETVVQKAVDKHMPLWMISLDLQKAFDRVEWRPLSEALLCQGVPAEYCSLIAALYSNQLGVLNADGTFNITRGVRQGDVLSPLLFNAALVQRMPRWKEGLSFHGIKVSDPIGAERLTNVRFADDLVIYANSLPELTEMVELLVDELRHAGLALNASKSKIFTLDEASWSAAAPTFVDIAGGMVEIMQGMSSHKYLGIHLPGHLVHRGNVTLNHRLKCAWSKFHMFRACLVNKHVDIVLRLRLLESVVTPCALYGLTTAPLTAAAFEKLAVAQRKMLRLMIGYVKGPDDSWADMHRRLSAKISRSLTKYPLILWSDELESRKRESNF